MGDYNGQGVTDTPKQLGFDHTGFEKFGGGDHKLGSLTRTTSIGEDWTPDHKKTSSQMLSQIHLCRFFYKLIERMERLNFGSDKLKVLMSTIIKGKFKEIQ